MSETAQVVIDAGGSVVEYDDDAQRLFGFERNAVVGRHILGLLQGSSVDVFEQAFRTWKSRSGAETVAGERAVELRRERAAPCAAEMTLLPSAQASRCTAQFSVLLPRKSSSMAAFPSAPPFGTSPARAIFLPSPTLEQHSVSRLHRSVVESPLLGSTRFFFDPTVPFADRSVEVATPVRAARLISPLARSTCSSGPDSPGSDPEDEASLNERVEDVLYGAAARLMPASSARARFNPHDVHKDIRLKYDLLAAVKTKPGLYRSARASTAIQANVFVYFEVTWDAEGKGGGVAVGLSTPDVPLDKLVGSVPHSVGLHSCGDLVCAGTWSKYGPAYAVGTTVGCLVRLTPRDDGQHASLQFYVSGDAAAPLRELIVFPKGQPVKPTVTLYAEKARIVGRFTRSEMRYTPRLPDGLEIFDLLGTCLQHRHPGDAALEPDAEPGAADPASLGAPDIASTPGRLRCLDFTEGDARLMIEPGDSLFSPPSTLLSAVSSPHVNSVASGLQSTFGFGGLVIRRDGVTAAAAAPPPSPTDSAAPAPPPHPHHQRVVEQRHAVDSLLRVPSLAGAPAAPAGGGSGGPAAAGTPHSSESIALPLPLPLPPGRAPTPAGAGAEPTAPADARARLGSNESQGAPVGQGPAAGKPPLAPGSGKKPHRLRRAPSDDALMFDMD